jgi:hypothetical protein
LSTATVCLVSGATLSFRPLPIYARDARNAESLLLLSSFSLPALGLGL